MSNIITLERPKHITSLRSTGILAELKVRTTTLTVRDNTISVQVAMDHNAQSSQVDVNKKLAATVGSFTLLQNVRQTAANAMNKYCYDFAGSFMFLPATRFESFFARADEIIAEHAKMKKAFLDDWEIFRSAQIFNNSNNTLFRNDEYQTREELEPKFSIRLTKMDVPIGDFREVLFKEALGDAEAAYQADVDEKVNTMLTQQFDEIAKLCKSLSECCDLRIVERGGETKVERPKLHTVTIQKAMEVCETFKKFNPSGSDRLEEARSMLADALAGVDIATLKNSDSQRLEVKAKIDEMINKFSL